RTFAREMNLDQTEFLDVLRTVSPDLILHSSLPAGYAEWMERRTLPADISKFLQDTALASEVEVGPVVFHDSRRIRAWDADFPNFIDRGFLSVASVLDGDFVVIDFQDEGTTGTISHDGDYWEESSDLRSMFTPVADSIGGFASVALEQR
ncbi:MAG: hypothetical protein MI807_10425, partial [Verrucomicrobiales bacterium]|nr:hypothetical protein [Verrucomicrobiales bacterium]